MRQDGIFIGGYMHSGTTLLQNIVGNHPQIYACPIETKFFEVLPFLKNRFNLNSEASVNEFMRFAISRHINNTTYIDLNWKDSEVFDDRASTEIYEAIKLKLGNQPSHSLIFAAIMGFMAEKQKTDAWIEKTPSNVFFYQRIFQGFPNAKLLLIVRDIRDVLASKKSRMSKSSLKERFPEELRKVKTLEKDFSPLVDSRSWIAAASKSLQLVQEKADQVYLVKYEDLVTTPESVTEDIWKFLGFPAYHSGIQEISRNPADLELKEQKGIDVQSVGRWQRVLTTREACFIQMRAKPILEKLGYQVLPYNSMDRLSSRILYLTGVFDFARRVYKRIRFLDFRLLPQYLKNFLKY